MALILVIGNTFQFVADNLLHVILDVDVVLLHHLCKCERYQWVSLVYMGSMDPFAINIAETFGKTKSFYGQLYL